jgi:ABC-type Fe3+ transport system permease subunit
MTDKELTKALLQLETAPAPNALDPRQLSRNIVERDQRRIRWLASIATFFWIAATGGIIWLAFLYFFTVEPRLVAYAAGRAQLQEDWQNWARAGDLAARSLLLCLVALLLAAISTITLVLLTRRATLRQINASLMEISQQLRATP